MLNATVLNTIVERDIIYLTSKKTFKKYKTVSFTLL